MDKLKSYKIVAHGASLCADIYLKDNQYIGKIYGDIIGMAQKLEPGKDVKPLEMEPYGPVELYADSPTEISDKVESKLKSEFNVISIKEIKSND